MRDLRFRFSLFPALRYCFSRELSRTIGLALSCRHWTLFVSAAASRRGATLPWQSWSGFSLARGSYRTALGSASVPPSPILRGYQNCS